MGSPGKGGANVVYRASPVSVVIDQKRLLSTFDIPRNGNCVAYLGSPIGRIAVITGPKHHRLLGVGNL